MSGFLGSVVSMGGGARCGIRTGDRGARAFVSLRAVLSSTVATSLWLFKFKLMQIKENKRCSFSVALATLQEISSHTVWATYRPAELAF